ncbi:hypothetical protein DFH08DRAFT_321263 [Mycena albidolilacea]|uniref:PPM-type phosphatase domain-containing protein n=1 Tax=Mycena albidolilacea TaxID=1033008 RepID=A0AAD7F085_9AGAR|nr:hypothetical protein DFH08DRAFT_321263 [Mycena albidolilacea]
MDSITGEVETISDGARSVGYIHRAELRSKGEDRIAVPHLEQGIIIAIFDVDGHCGSQLSDFAAQKLPALLSERLRADNVDVEAVMKDTIEEFDRSLLLPLLGLFDEGEDWSDPKWLNTETEVYPRIGDPDKDDERYAAGMRATVGSTALIAFLDKQRKYLWVASLGDCDAGYVGDTRTINGLPCSSANATTATTPPKSNVLSHFCPPRLEPQEILDFNSWTPPYMSSTPSIRHHNVLSGDMFVFASDGLRDQVRVPNARKFDIIFWLASGRHDDDLEAGLGHECVPAQVGDNVAERCGSGTKGRSEERRRFGGVW